MGFDVRLENRTPFAAATHVQLDAEGQEVLLLVVSASFEAAISENPLEIAEDQLPVCLSDEAFGDPARSSTRYEADIAREKPGFEVIVLGTAHAPNDQPTERLAIGLKAGPLRKVLTVTGDRLHAYGKDSSPVPFRRMPVTWERAFGGTASDGACDPRNPVGIGYRQARSADPDARSELPNITYAGDTRPDPQPVGFAPVGRGWQPRIGYAGTYDEAWKAEQWPLPPRDFDPRHNLFAPGDQWLEDLPPGSEIAVTHMTPSGLWRFALPALDVPVHLLYADRVETSALRPDTVILEPDLLRVTLKARVAVQLVRNAQPLRDIAVGHFSPVWLSARRKRKTYLNLTGGDGTLPGRPVWRP